MKLTYAKLKDHLAKTLAPLYWISGDEPLLVQEAIDTIREKALQVGFTERVSLTVESDWEAALYSDTHHLSLFSQKKIVELSLSKVTAAIGKTLETYALKPLEDMLLIIRAPKMDAKIEKSAWYQVLDKTGIIIPIWPISTEELPDWILQRAKKFNVLMTKQGAEHFAMLVEGNLLAAATEIEKIALLHSKEPLDHEAIEAIVTDYARFDIFQFVESTVAGNRSRAIRILKNLRAEETEPTLLLWALTRELRMLAELQKLLKQGETLANLFGKFRVWGKRQASIRAFLKRKHQQDCWELLINAAKIDRIIKGAEKGNVWDALGDFSLKML